MSFLSSTLRSVEEVHNPAHAVVDDLLVSFGSFLTLRHKHQIKFNILVINTLIRIIIVLANETTLVRSNFLDSFHRVCLTVFIELLNMVYRTRCMSTTCVEHTSNEISLDERNFEVLPPTMSKI
jgi:hypothetical protein